MLGHLSGANIPALCAKVLHPGQSKLTQVAMLHTTAEVDKLESKLYKTSPPGDQWHGDVSLHPVDTSPRGNKSKDPCNKINQSCSWVALIAARLPQLIQPCSPETQIEHIEQLLKIYLMTRVGYSLRPSGRNLGFSKNSMNCWMSRSRSTLGKSGIIWVTTLGDN